MKSTVTLLGEVYELVKPFHVYSRYTSRFFGNGMELEDLIGRILSVESIAKRLLFDVRIGGDAIVWDDNHNAILILTMDNHSIIVRTIMETSRHYVYVTEGTTCIYRGLKDTKARVEAIAEDGRFRRSIPK